MYNKVLVTGATGHLGNVLLRRLADENFSIRILCLPGENTDHIDDLNFEKVVGNMTNPQDVDNAVDGCDAVFHLASLISIEKGTRKKLKEVNINGTNSLVNTCIKHDVKRLAYVSSVHALTEPPMGQAFIENTDFEQDVLLGDYAWSKAHASLKVKAGIEKGLDAIFVYPSGIVGPYDYMGTNNILKQLKAFLASKGTVRYFEGAYDYVDVRDVADGIIKAFYKGQAGESFLLTGEQVSLKRVYETFMEISQNHRKMKPVSYNLVKMLAVVNESYHRMIGKKTEFTTYSVEVLKSNSLFNNEQTRQRLGYESRPFEESMVDTFSWFND